MPYQMYCTFHNSHTCGCWDTALADALQVLEKRAEERRERLKKAARFILGCVVLAILLVPLWIALAY